MTEQEFQALERWVFAAANVLLVQETRRGDTVVRCQNLYNEARAEARKALVQPKENQK